MTDSQRLASLQIQFNIYTMQRLKLLEILAMQRFSRNGYIEDPNGVIARIAKAHGVDFHNSSREWCKNLIGIIEGKMENFNKMIAEMAESGSTSIT